jgi:hypothetical protein
MHNVRALGAVFSLFILISATGCSFAPGASVTYPDLEPADGPHIPAEYTYSFPFQDDTVTLTIPVDPDVYWGARTADKKAVLHSNLEDEAWLPGYYRAFIEDDDLSPLIDGICAGLQSIRDEAALTQDEYLELATVFVQSIPYATDSRIIEPKYPVETIVDGMGDCDDKSLLLAAILAHEGYEVALFYFATEDHMATGIRAPAGNYKNSGYAFIETTNITLVGIPPRELDGGIALSSEPTIIPVSSGATGYTKCDETIFIRDTADSALNQITVLQTGIERLDADLAAQRALLINLKHEMDYVLKAGRTGDYDRLVQTYNSRTTAYNQDINTYNTLRSDYTRQVGMYNAIISHQYDRKGTYIWLKEQEQGMQR